MKEAWTDYCRRLERAGLGLLDARPDASPAQRAEAAGYLLGLVTSGIRQALELSDPDTPRFVRNPDHAARWGAENADNQYLWTRIRPNARYRITGERSSAFDFLIEVKEGYMQLGDERNFATLTAAEIDVDDDGRFELIASAERPANARCWLPLHRDARYVCVRQYLCDWQSESPAHFAIERLGGEGESPAALTLQGAEALLEAAGRWTEATAAFWNEWIERMLADFEPGTIRPARKLAGGADDIYYGNDLYRIAPSEALVIETELPRARYWSFQLGDLWFRSLDWANHQTSINHAQALVDADGRFRCVVAHRDPGVPNWLDTCGNELGMLQYRWIWSEDNPLPDGRIVAFDEIRDALPRDTPSIGRDQRRAAIHVRQRHRARREPVT